MANSRQNTPHSQPKKDFWTQRLEDEIAERTMQAYMDGASHEEVGELQQQLKNGTFDAYEWERMVASWHK